MKNERQYNDSALFAFIGMVFILLLLLITLAQSCDNEVETTQKQHNFQVGELTAQDSLELKEPDAIYYDTINEYITDIDVDYGDEIFDSSLLDCTGSDEYIMWVGDNGDTIWE